MFYIVVPELSKVIAWSNKCGGSSMRRQLLHDLNNESLMQEMKDRHVTPYEIVSERYQTNPPVNQVPMHYKFEWYVRDPFYRTLSCYINRKILIEGGDPELTFRTFVLNLGYYRSISNNIYSHTEPQMKNFFEAPWNVIDINCAHFSFKQKMNSTQYTLGDKKNAWDIPAKDVVLNSQTYSAVSFYSQEIARAIKDFYRADYEYLKDKIRLI